MPLVMDHAAFEFLSEQRHNLEACIRCGLCLETCPTYLLSHLEEESPRGRIALAKALLDGHLELTKDLVEHELSCLVCEGCTAVCPAGVRMEEIAVAFRADLSATGAMPRRTRIASRLLRVLGDRPQLVRTARRLALARRLGLVRLGSWTGILRLLGVAYGQVPPVPRDFVEPDGRAWEPLSGPARGRVVLFAGCVMSTLLAPTDVATGELLAAAGYEVIVASGQTCCGALAAHSGDAQTAISLAERNLRALGGGSEPIVVNSAGCGAFLKQYGSVLGARGAAMADRVVDVTELLADSPLDLSGSPPSGPVAFQDPCHARLAQGIVDAPRRLLSRIPGLELVELDEPEICCGSAGVYNVTDRARSRELAHRKAEAIATSGARTVVTTNPGCLLQVRGALRELGVTVSVRHLADVLREACPTPVRAVPARSLEAAPVGG